MRFAWKRWAAVFGMALWISGGGVGAGEAQKPAEDSATAQASAKSGKEKPEPPRKQDEKKARTEKKGKGEPEVVIVEPGPEHAAKAARWHARAERELRERIQKNIRRLATSGWKEAQAELVRIGKPAVSFLMDALETNPASEEAYPRQAYALQAPGRATRQRPLDDLAFEVLTNMIQNHSAYKGKLPGRDKKAWEAFWTLHGEAITFGHPPSPQAP